MKKLIAFLPFLCLATFIFGQSDRIHISCKNTSLELGDKERYILEASDFSLIQLDIRTDLTLYIEDIEVKIRNDYRALKDKIQLVEVNPSKNTSWKDYQIIFNIENESKSLDIDFSIKNEILNNTIKLQFNLKQNPFDISITWKTPIQANRDDKTGIETILPKYVVNLEINSSEPLLENNFKILLDGIYQKDKVSPQKIKSKSIIGQDGKTIYQYNYTCKINLHEGINKIKLEIETKHYVPNQKKFYSSILYLNKVK